jgi:small-conductance mechanosensitive channel
MTEDILTYVWSSVQQVLTDYFHILFELLPKAFGAVAILFLGWILGRVFGRAVELAIRYSGAEATIAKTDIGTKLRDSGYNIAKLFNVVSRMAVYLASLGLAVKALGVEEITLISRSVLAMAQTVVVGVAAFTVGVVIVETVVDFGKKIIGSRSPYLNLAISTTHLILLFVVTLTALSLAGVDISSVVYFVGNLSIGIGIGIGFSLSLMTFIVFRPHIEEFLKNVTVKHDVEKRGESATPE